METIKFNNKEIDILAKELWQSILNLQDMVFADIHDDDSAQFYIEFLNKSSEFARYIDKNFYNDCD